MLTPVSVVRAAERLEGRVRKTPVVPSPWLSAITGADVRLKLENHQIEGSFKTRGALHALHQAGATRAVTASAGNHGRSLAFAASSLGVALTVFAPRTAPRAKLDYIGAHGASLELCDSYDEAERRALEHASRLAVPYISPYNHRDVIAGAGTVGLEAMTEQADVMVVPVGGGGLVSGIALAVRNAPAPPAVIGVEALASPVFTTALAHGGLVPIEVGHTLADGLAGNAEPGSMTFELIRDNVSDVLAVSEEQIAAAMRGLLAHDGQRVEGAGAVAAAALLAGIAGLAGKRVVVIVSGGNVDDATLASV